MPLTTASATSSSRSAPNNMSSSAFSQSGSCSPPHYPQVNTEWAETYSRDTDWLPNLETPVTRESQGYYYQTHPASNPQRSQYQETWPHYNKTDSNSINYHQSGYPDTNSRHQHSSHFEYSNGYENGGHNYYSETRVPQRSIPSRQNTTLITNQAKNEIEEDADGDNFASAFISGLLCSPPSRTDMMIDDFEHRPPPVPYQNPSRANYSGYQNYNNLSAATSQQGERHQNEVQIIENQYQYDRPAFDNLQQYASPPQEAKAMTKKKTPFFHGQPSESAFMEPPRKRSKPIPVNNHQSQWTPNAYGSDSIYATNSPAAELLRNDNQIRQDSWEESSSTSNTDGTIAKSPPISQPKPTVSRKKSSENTCYDRKIDKKIPNAVRKVSPLSVYAKVQENVVLSVKCRRFKKRTKPITQKPETTCPDQEEMETFKQNNLTPDQAASQVMGDLVGKISLFGNSSSVAAADITKMDQSTIWQRLKHFCAKNHLNYSEFENLSFIYQPRLVKERPKNSERASATPKRTDVVSVKPEPAPETVPKPVRKRRTNKWVQEIPLEERRVLRNLPSRKARGQISIGNEASFESPNATTGPEKEIAVIDLSTETNVEAGVPVAEVPKIVRNSKAKTDSLKPVKNHDTPVKQTKKSSPKTKYKRSRAKSSRGNKRKSSRKRNSRCRKRTSSIEVVDLSDGETPSPPDITTNVIEQRSPSPLLSHLLKRSRLSSQGSARRKSFEFQDMVPMTRSRSRQIQAIEDITPEPQCPVLTIEPETERSDEEPSLLDLVNAARSKNRNVNFLTGCSIAKHSECPTLEKMPAVREQAIGSEASEKKQFLKPSVSKPFESALGRETDMEGSMKQGRAKKARSREKALESSVIGNQNQCDARTKNAKLSASMNISRRLSSNVSDRCGNGNNGSILNFNVKEEPKSDEESLANFQDPIVFGKTSSRPKKRNKKDRRTSTEQNKYDSHTYPVMIKEEPVSDEEHRAPSIRPKKSKKNKREKMPTKGENQCGMSSNPHPVKVKEECVSENEEYQLALARCKKTKKRKKERRTSKDRNKSAHVPELYEISYKIKEELMLSEEDSVISMDPTVSNAQSSPSKNDTSVIQNSAQLSLNKTNSKQAKNSLKLTFTKNKSAVSNTESRITSKNGMASKKVPRKTKKSPEHDGRLSTHQNIGSSNSSPFPFQIKEELISDDDEIPLSFISNNSNTTQMISTKNKNVPVSSANHREEIVYIADKKTCSTASRKSGKSATAEKSSPRDLKNKKPNQIKNCFYKDGPSIASTSCLSFELSASKFLPEYSAPSDKALKNNSPQKGHKHISASMSTPLNSNSLDEKVCPTSTTKTTPNNTTKKNVAEPRKATENTFSPTPKSLQFLTKVSTKSKTGRKSSTNQNKPKNSKTSDPIVSELVPGTWIKREVDDEPNQQELIGSCSYMSGGDVFKSSTKLSNLQLISQNDAAALQSYNVNLSQGARCPSTKLSPRRQVIPPKPITENTSSQYRHSLTFSEFENSQVIPPKPMTDNTSEWDHLLSCSDLENTRNTRANLIPQFRNMDLTTSTTEKQPRCFKNSSAHSEISQSAIVPSRGTANAHMTQDPGPSGQVLTHNMPVANSPGLKAISPEPASGTTETAPGSSSTQNVTETNPPQESEQRTVLYSALVASGTVLREGLVSSEIVATNLSRPPKCDNCRTTDAKFLCSGCRKNWYCCSQCQVMHWPQHTDVCHANTFKEKKSD